MPGENRISMMIVFIFSCEFIRLVMTSCADSSFLNGPHVADGVILQKTGSMLMFIFLHGCQYYLQVHRPIPDTCDGSADTIYYMAVMGEIARTHCYE